MVMYTFSPSTQEMESGRTELQGHLQLDSKSEASLAYTMSPRQTTAT